MTRVLNRMVLAAAVVSMTAVMSEAQQTTSTETKTFEVLAVDGNTLVVRLPEGTRELSVADDFRFIIDGKPMSVRELKVGMKGSATITTKTTMTPVTVTVCAVFQFALVNVSDAGDTVPAAVSSDDRSTSTSAVGSAVNTTVNVAVPPASVVVRPEVGVTVTPDASLSVLLTDTLAGFKPSPRVPLE